MSADVIVGLLTLLGLVYMAWAQREVRRSETRTNEAEAVNHLMAALLQAAEQLAERDRLVVELRSRVEALEEHDRLKSSQIEELKHKVEQLEGERSALLEERDRLAARLADLEITDKLVVLGEGI